MRNARVLIASVNYFILSIRQPRKRIITVHNFFLLMTRIQLLIHHFFRNFAVKQMLASIELLGIKLFSSKDICEIFVKNTYWFPKFTTSINAFLADCLYLDETIDLHEVNSKAPFEGEIGAGDILLHKYLKFSKFLRMHAIFKDTYGYMRSNKNVGPGYLNTSTTRKYFRNSMLLCLISGILYRKLMKFFNSQRFDNFPF